MTEKNEQTTAKNRLSQRKGRGKKYANATSLIDRNKRYGVTEALDLLSKVSFAKFDETVEVAFKLGIDPRHADQMVRGAVVLPHGTGKSAKVLVLTKGEKLKEAETAGADFVGGDDLVDKIKGGWMDFDKVIATPDMMVSISKIGKILGPRGLMPNPKLGTVTMDVTKAIEDQKKGKVEYRAEKTGIVQVPIGKKSFGAEKLKENFSFLAGTIVRAKPPTSKGTYLKKVTVSTTMSPGVTLDSSDVSSMAG